MGPAGGGGTSPPELPTVADGSCSMGRSSVRERDEPDTATHRLHSGALGHALGADDPLPIDPDLDPDDRAEPSPTHRAGVRRPRRTHPGILGVIVAGGFLGTLGRYEVYRAWPTAPTHFPTGTLVINTSGAFLLGLLLTLLLEHRTPEPLGHYVRPFVGTGLLGGWTTYSTFAVGAVVLIKAGNLGTAVAYLLATLVAGTVAVVAGMALGRLGGDTTVGTRLEPATADDVEGDR